jgi:hypothetical protein
MKTIKIKSCQQCPYSIHRFWVWYCKKCNVKCNQGPTIPIPAWCPLESINSKEGE